MPIKIVIPMNVHAGTFVFLLFALANFFISLTNWSSLKEASQLLQDKTASLVIGIKGIMYN